MSHISIICFIYAFYVFVHGVIRSLCLTGLYSKSNIHTFKEGGLHSVPPLIKCELSLPAFEAKVKSGC